MVTDKTEVVAAMVDVHRELSYAIRLTERIARASDEDSEMTQARVTLLFHSLQVIRRNMEEMMEGMR